MMKMQPIQTGFASGELTPRLFGNTSAEVYRNGVAEMHNMHPLEQGPAESRFGSLYRGDAGNDDAVRLIPFNVSRGDSFAIEFGPEYMRIWDADGLVSIGGQELIQDVSFVRDFLFWDDNSTGGIITFNHPVGQAVLENLTGSNIAILSQRTRDIIAPNIGEQHILRGSKTDVGTLRIQIGTTEGGNDVLDELVTVVGDFSFLFFPLTAENWIQFTNDTGPNTSIGVITPRFHAVATTDSVVTPYTIDEIDELQYEMLSSTDTLVIVHAKHPPKELILTFPADFQLLDIPFVSPPGQWVGENWPNVVTTFQGRLWLARTPNELQTLWASQSGDYFNFEQGTSQANEGLEFSLAAAGEIEWLRGQKDLLMGTSLGEHRITASGGAITPSDIDIRQQSAFGSAILQQGQNIGDQVLYVSPDRKKVRALTFDVFQQGWYSPDLTWSAEHITESGIKEIHYVRDPNNRIACVLRNGKVAVCTYDRAHEVNGWMLASNDNAEVISIAVINGEEGSSIFSAVKQSNGKMVIIIDPITFDARVNMDSAIARPIEVGGIVTGLEHLEGMEVVIKVDGAVHPKETVVGGQITLEYSGTVALVGLGYVSKLRTLPLDVGSSNGSGLANLKHWAKIYVQLIDSAIPKINGIRPPTRYPETPMNIVQPSVTQTVQATDLGRTRPAQITIEQDLPLRLTILNLVGIQGQDVL